MPHRSLWLDEALSADEPAAPPLEGAARADVAIMGGGYAGLWTAIRIKQREPSCDVVVLEQDICGGGASGRNGGFAISWWAKLGTLVELCGADGALELARACEDGRGRARRVLRRARHRRALPPRRAPLDDDVAGPVRGLGRRHGDLPRARRDAVRGVVGRGDRAAQRHGSPPRGPLRALRARSCSRRVLVRGLRRVALELGVRIHEGTRVTKLDRRSPAVLHTPRGVAHRRPRRRRDERLGRRAARAAHAARDHLERHRRDRADARAAGARSAGRGTSASATRG